MGPILGGGQYEAVQHWTYTARVNLTTKVLDFVQLGGVDPTSDPSGFSIPSGVSFRWLQLFPTLGLRHDVPGTALVLAELATEVLHRGARTGTPALHRKRSASLVIQQPVPHRPHHDLLLRVKTQLHLNGVDGVSDGNRLDFPSLRNRGV